LAGRAGLPALPPGAERTIVVKVRKLCVAWPPKGGYRRASKRDDHSMTMTVDRDLEEFAGSPRTSYSASGDAFRTEACQAIGV
jgi:hypothetical protein